MGDAAQTPEEQNRELVRSSELGRDSCGSRLGDLSCSMPRLSARSLDSGAHRAANCGGERQAIEQRSRRGWEGSPILAVDHPWGPAAAPVTANLDALAPRRVACPVLSCPSPRMTPGAAPPANRRSYAQRSAILSSWVPS